MRVILEAEIMQRIFRRRFWPLLLTVLSLVFMLGLSQGMPLGISVAMAQSPSASPATSPSPAASDELTDGVEINMTVLGFDPIKGEVETRVEFTPKGKYEVPETQLAAQNMLLTTNNVDKQGSVVTFRAKRYMDPHVMRFTVYDGDANSYPFDSYTSEASFYLESFTGNNDPDQATNFEQVPTVVNTFATIPGYEITITPGAEDATAEYHQLAINVTRSGTVMFFSVVVMVIMWILAILALSLAIRVWRSGKLPEVGMLGLMAALLFAFPSIRNAQPNVPPIGTLGDFLSFLWTESIVVIALVILGLCWLKRYNPAEKLG